MIARALRGAPLAATFLLSALAVLPLPARAQAAASLAWGTYLGGSGTDYISAIAQAPTSGNVVVVGHTTSQDFPPRAGTGTSPSRDAFLHIFSAAGMELGGRILGSASGDDLAFAVAIDPQGLIFVAGQTTAGTFPDFPPPIIPYSSQEDGFLACFDADGTPKWLLYLGSSGVDSIEAIAVSGTDVYVTGFTTSGATFLGGGGTALGGSEGFVVKLDVSSSAPRVVWHTLISGDDTDDLHSITLDGAGSVLVAGLTSSTELPSSLNTSHGGDDGLAAKLSAADGSLTWVTFLGGAGADDGRGIVVTPDGSLVVVGVSDSTPTNKDAFVTWLSSAGGQLATKSLGGLDNEGVAGVALDSSGNLYIGGWTSSRDFPLEKAFDTDMEPGSAAREGFVVMLPAGRNRPMGWASFVGGNSLEAVTGLSISSENRLVLSGLTSSSSGLISTSPYDPTLAADFDGFILALDIDVTSPLAGRVYDRPQEDTVHQDVDTQTSTTSLSANWEGFSDPESSIVGYACAFGTTPGLDDVSPFTPTTTPLKTSCAAQPLTLTPGQTYYVTVRATNGAGLTTTVSSNGVRVSEPSGTDGGTHEPPTEDDQPLLGFSCTAADAGLPMLVGLLALVLLARRRDASSR